MSRLLKISVVFLLLFSLLTGCGLFQKTFTCQDLNITLPSGFKDYSDAEEAKNFDFLYLSDQVGIAGVRTQKISLQSNNPNMTLEQFAQFVADESGLEDAVISQNDGIYNFTYELDTDQKSYTYLVAVFEDDISFWALQCYSVSEDFSDVRDDIWEYLSTVTISDR